MLTACATLVAGNDGVTAIRQWAARTPQDVLHRLGARRNPLTGRYLVPSERTFRRVLAAVDGDILDTATCGYAADVVRGDTGAPQVPAAAGEPTEREQRRATTRAVTHPAPAGLLPAVAVDGKLLHGTRTEAGQVFLVGAVTHDRAVVLGQRQSRHRLRRTRPESPASLREPAARIPPPWPGRKGIAETSKAGSPVLSSWCGLCRV